jgi:hypothetical protein
MLERSRRTSLVDPTSKGAASVFRRTYEQPNGRSGKIFKLSHAFTGTAVIAALGLGGVIGASGVAGAVEAAGAPSGGPAVNMPAPPEEPTLSPTITTRPDHRLRVASEIVKDGDEALHDIEIGLGR